jgi:chemotaxis protein methyltransferase CheR
MKYTLPEHTLSQLSEFVADHLGLNYPRERWSDLQRNITAASTEFGYTDAGEFIEHMISSPLTIEHVEILTTHLTTNETYFWREPEVFEALEHSIIPELIESRQNNKKIRIWSAGCSTGEEPYSIAIALHKVVPQIRDWNITILATDVNSRVLQRARAGVFGQRSFRNAPEWLRAKYFSLDAKDTFEIVPEIKAMVAFKYLNLAADVSPLPPADTKGMDIIFCRNVLMYFSAIRRSAIMRRFFTSLIQNGYLVVSASELSLKGLSAFKAVNVPGMVLFQKTSKNPNAQQTIPVERPNPALLENPERLQSSKRDEQSQPRLRENEVLHDAESLRTSASMYEKAMALYAQGKYEDVIEMLQKHDGASEERSLLIRAYANQGELEKALQSCEMAIRADKLNPGLHYLQATLLQEGNRLDEAISALKRATFLDSNFVLSYYSLGKIYRRLGNVQSANKCTTNALTILNACSQDDILYESEGLTAGRFKEIILAEDYSRDQA